MQSGRVFFKVLLKQALVSIFRRQQVLDIIVSHCTEDGYKVAPYLVFHQAVHLDDLLDGLHVALSQTLEEEFLHILAQIYFLKVDLLVLAFLSLGGEICE